MEDNKTIHSGNEIDERGGIINEVRFSLLH